MNTSTAIHSATTPATLPAIIEALVWSHGDVDVLHICEPGKSRIEVVEAGTTLLTIPTTRQWLRERARARRWAEARLGLRGYDSLDGLADRAAKRKLVILLTNSLDYLTKLSTADLATRYGRGAARRTRGELVRGITARAERTYSRLPVAELKALWA
ncbi:MAG: hypothetical protein WCI67_15260 [Chloroflexales bacterium]